MAVVAVKGLSMLVLSSRDRHENLWLPQECVYRAKPDNNIFLQHTAMKSIGTMLLAP